MLKFLPIWPLHRGKLYVTVASAGWKMKSLVICMCRSCLGLMTVACFIWRALAVATLLSSPGLKIMQCISCGSVSFVTMGKACIHLVSSSLRIIAGVQCATVCDVDRTLQQDKTRQGTFFVERRFCSMLVKGEKATTRQHQSTKRLANVFWSMCLVMKWAG